MVVPPIVEREFRLALRRHASGKSRFKTAALAAALVALFLLFSVFMPSRTWSSTLYEWLFYGGLYLAVVPSLQISTALFVEERRNQTMELLHLAGLGPGSLFLGKLTGGLLIASGDLLALVPFLAIPFLGGGISFPLYVATVASLPVLLLFVVATGVLASVLWKTDGSALVGALSLGALLCLALPLLYNLGRLLTGTAPFAARWLCLSPAFGPYLVHAHFSGGTQRSFWLNELITLSLAGSEVVLAAIFLRQGWKRQVAGAAPGRWEKTWQECVHGTARWRRDLRDKLLPQYPYQWLAQQDRGPVLLAWMVLGGGTLAWLAISAAWPRIGLSTTIIFGLGVLLVGTVQIVAIYAAGRRIGADRQEGTLELVLTTPLSVGEIVQGQVAAIQAQFRPVRRALLGVCLLMMAGGFCLRSFNTAAAIECGLIWVVLLSWPFCGSRQMILRAMWKALNTGRPMFGVFRVQGGRWVWFYYYLWYGRIIFNAFTGKAVLFPTGSPVEVMVVSIACCCVLLVLAVATYQENHLDLQIKLLRDMRTIAQEPVPEANDPRLKSWDGQNRLPSRR
jgi:ABC-type transport system involved in multi-copper enzyme maturation permease subunit